MMNSGICPYPGLRPFTEEESIFFKGRDTHIREIAKMLETKKMAFITGASGDGKSSMVYAGVVPFVRAGFLKAKFNKWIIADFKPQRNPLKSLCTSIAQQTGLESGYLIDELGYGFTSIIEVYKQSGLYAEGQNAVNQGKNLLIIADQFEEMFTNKDNFDNGTPSIESYTTVNLLLETVRFAVTENLPVYVVFTMRSDFISQCTVFKNLPEFIAYSQFFVPQLKRAEITQVITQPALLAGGSVSSRLADYLVNNLGSGFDQLPVLQHTMNLLWKTADDGKQQLDLIHLAKIAGISPNVLNKDDRDEFGKFFANLPDFKKKYYDKPALNNVLNAHAGILFDSAFDYYQSHANWAQKNISKDDAALIVETAFKSLVKIDNARPVRNRCTVDEITGSVNRENVTNAVVCGCLNIYRDQDNSLLRPFIENETIENQYLDGNAVLDITHEALVRNWKMLAQWNAQEEIFVKDYYDFKSQMNRWIANDRAKNFLLPEGSLVYFEKWIQDCNLTPYWIAKYDAQKIPQHEKILYADSEYHDSLEYLRESRNAVEAARNRKNRRRKIIAAAAVAVIALMAGFTFWALAERNLAQSETNRANKKSAELNLQMQANDHEKQRALEAEKTADKERQKAYKEAVKARQAQEDAAKAYKAANSARILADSMKNVALENLRSAEDARKKTEDALARAERENVRANQATDSATRLYYTAVSSALALKAQNRYEDKSLNLRLAWSSFLMCRECGVTMNTADLYQAMLFSMTENGFDCRLEVTSDPIADFHVSAGNNIYVLTDKPEIIGYKIAGSNPQEFLRFGCDVSSPVEKAVFVSDDKVLFSTKDKLSFITDLKTQKTTPLPRNGYLTAACQMGENLFATSTADGILDVWTITPPNCNLLKTNKLQSKISDIKASADGQSVYILLHDGELLEYDIYADKMTVLLDKKPLNGYSMSVLSDTTLIAASFSDGKIRYVNTYDKTTYEVLASNAKTDRIVYDANTGRLARSSADKRIMIVDRKNFMQQPCTIEEYNLGGGKVKALKFNKKGVLFVLTDLNELRYFDTDIQQYARSIGTLNLQPLNDMEKRMILGNEFISDY